MSNLVSKSRSFWAINKAGTRYVREKAAPAGPRPAPSEAPSLKGEGDETLAVLFAIRNTIRKPELYCGTARAFDGQMQPCDPASIAAVRWSIFGALDRITSPGYTPQQRREILARIKQCLPVDAKARPLFHWEEDPDTSHGAVLALLNRAITARKRELGYLK